MMNHSASRFPLVNKTPVGVIITIIKIYLTLSEKDQQYPVNSISHVLCKKSLVGHDHRFGHGSGQDPGISG